MMWNLFAITEIRFNCFELFDWYFLFILRAMIFSKPTTNETDSQLKSFIELSPE